MLMLGVLVVLLVARDCTSARDGTCGGFMTSPFVRLPKGLSLQDFERFIVGNKMQEVYFTLPKPPVFLPYDKFSATIWKSPTQHGRYYRVAEGETPPVNPQCQRGNVSMQLFPKATDARFIQHPDNPALTSLRVVWSSCPDKYIWSLRCKHGPVLRITRCPIDAIELALFVHQTTMDDLPLGDIIQDLRATGIRFAANNFKWFHTFGLSTLC